jgi:hypothetical protein
MSILQLQEDIFDMYRESLTDDELCFENYMDICWTSMKNRFHNAQAAN